MLELQSWWHAVRFSAELLGALCGAFLYNRKDWGWGLTYSSVIFTLSAVVVLVIPFTLMVREVPQQREASTVQLRKMFGVIQTKAAWLPMLYIYRYYTTPGLWLRYIPSIRVRTRVAPRTESLSDSRTMCCDSLPLSSVITFFKSQMQLGIVS